MVYTDEHKKKIESNLDQIISYIKKEIQPNIPPNEQISVHFFSENSLHENKIYVSEHGIDGYVGAAHVHFDKDNKKSYCECVYEHIDWMLGFVLGWKDAKQGLHEKLDKKIQARQQIINAIENFEV